MSLRLLRNALINQYHERPQIVREIDHAVELAGEALRLLAKHGHQFHLADGPDTSSRFPRLMFHLEAAPRGHLVFCQEDIEILGEGWWPTLDEAKHADGLGMQYRRGGIVPKRGLPAIVLVDK